jgi:hypothetical protein
MDVFNRAKPLLEFLLDDPFRLVLSFAARRMHAACKPVNTNGLGCGDRCRTGRRL